MARGLREEDGDPTGDFGEGEGDDLVGEGALFAELAGPRRGREERDVGGRGGGEADLEEEEGEKGARFKAPPPKKEKGGGKGKEKKGSVAEEAGSEVPPLEEFKRLMESLGPDGLFDDEVFGEEEEIDEDMLLAGKQVRGLGVG